MGLETTHAACVRRNYNANIVSTTQDEAADKLKTGDLLYSSIPDEWAEYGFKPLKWKNAAEELAFHEPPFTSSIVSKPGTSAVRGGKKDMYYDEAAHIREFAKLWQAGLPAIIRGSGRVTVVSTPLGQSGLYYELWNNEEWSHHQIPWWHSRFMVKGGTEEAVMEAMAFAPEMGTEERLERFASEKLLKLFEIGTNSDILVFKTEFECEFVDEREAYFPYGLLVACKNTAEKPWVNWHDGYQTTNPLYIGVDLATKRDATVITVVEKTPEKSKILFFKELHDTYDEQFKELKALAQSVRPNRISIDETGPGQMFAQKARLGQLEVPCLIETISFTNDKKETWATTFKGDLQTDRVEFPDNPRFLSQTHGIRRTRTETGRFKFAGDPDDYFWSAMLALYGANRVPIRFSRV